MWNYYKDEPINPYLSPPVNSNPPTVNCDADPITNSASHLNTRALDKTLGKTLDSDDDNARNNNRRCWNKNEKQRCWNCCAIKTFKHLLENFRHALINCEISLVLTWSEKCVLTDIVTHDAVVAQEYHPACSENCILTDIVTHDAVTEQRDNLARPEIRAPTNSSLKTKATKLYLPVVTLSTEGDNKVLEQLKIGFKKLLNGINIDQNV